MRSILAVATLALIALAVEDKARQVAGEASEAAGEVAGQAREVTATLSHRVEGQPLISLLVAGTVGFVLARLAPRRTA